MSSASTYCLTSRLRVAGGIGRNQPRVACRASSMLSATVRSSITPSARRFSLENAILLSIACRGVRNRCFFARTSSSPPSAESAPNSSRASSVRPEPSSPATPMTSPSNTSRSTASRDPLRLRPNAFSTGVPASLTSVAATSRSMRSSVSSSRPIIIRTSSISVTSLVIRSPTRAPLRSTVMRSLISKIWSRKCETKTIATPWSRSVRITSKSLATSSPSRLEVGSSRIRTLQSTSTARAMATSCCTAIGCCPSCEAGSMSRPSRSRVPWPDGSSRGC